MSVNEWKSMNNFVSAGITADTKKTFDGIEINNNENEYKIAKFASEKKKAKGNTFYEFYNNYISEKMLVRFLFSFLDKNGKEIYRGYFKNGEVYKSPENAEFVILEVIATSFEKSYAKIFDAGLKISDRKYKKAVVASACINYGFLYEHPSRTMEDNFLETIKIIDKLNKQQKVDLLVFTECFLSRNAEFEKPEDAFVKESGTEITKMREKAKEYGIYLAFSYREITEDNRCYNTALLIGRDGEIKLRYHKTHLTVTEYECGIIPGNELKTYETEFGTIGFSICWDFFFPDQARELKKLGADIIINPSAGFYKEMSIQRARDNGVYVINSGTYQYSTAIYNTNGKNLATANDMLTPGVAIASIDVSDPEHVRYLSVNSAGDNGNMKSSEMREDLYTNGNYYD